MGDTYCSNHEALKEEIAELNRRQKETEMRLIAVEKRSAVSDEQIKMIFNIINEIKGSINTLVSKFDEIERRPSSLIWAVSGTVIGALIVYAVLGIR